jgi:prepilin-type N-terminal cleavage/methylation domain-containing protein
MRSKVQAFTLPELLVVMVLMGIVTGILYTAYYTINTYLFRLEKRHEAIQEYSDVYFTLQADVERCSALQALDDHTLTLTAPDSTRIVYEFLGESVVRHQANRIDTLNCQNGRVQFSFLQKPRLSGSVDKVSFDTETTWGLSRIVVFKPYDASMLIRLTPFIQEDEQP